MRFRKTRRGIAADLDEVEAAVLRRFVTDVAALLEQDDQPADADPLAGLVGLPASDTPRPVDPALARLLPDAYRDDPEASTQFRRYTDADLRAGKRAHAAAVLATLPDGPGRVLLDRDGADAWLGTLNDLRLVLGTRLGVTEELDLDRLDEDDPRTQALHVYDWLGALQESLLRCLDPRR
ncbi:MAG: DUF2017 domain-containing protein [Actinomycetota bacterium]|nr:DUF2017 domain-containing protein [Actinomycetota bacterium]